MSETVPAWKARLDALKKRVEEAPTLRPTAQEEPAEEATVVHQKPLPEIVPGDMGKPQNEFEAEIEADRQLGNAAKEDVVKSTERVLTAEMIYTETMAQSEHSFERDDFDRAFINGINEVLGMDLDGVEESLRRDHKMLFDLRSGIQGKLAYYKRLMKDTDAQDRARRMEKDKNWMPTKKAASEKPKKEKSEKKKAEPKSMIEVMADAMRAKGLSEDVIRERLKAFEGKL